MTFISAVDCFNHFAILPLVVLEMINVMTECML